VRIVSHWEGPAIIPFLKLRTGKERERERERERIRAFSFLFSLQSIKVQYGTLALLPH